MLSLTYEGLPIFPYHPSKVTQGVGSYMSSRNLILAHGHVYHLYQKEFRESQNGKISLAMLVEWLEPLDPNSAEDKNAADGANNAQLGCFAEAIFGSGDFPERMKEKIEDLSKKEGFPRPRLPEFSPEEKQLVKGTSDYFALNYYGACLVTPALQPSESSVIAYLGVNAFPPWWLPVSNSSRWLTVAPQGIRKLMRFIKEKYGDLQIFVTENGYSDNGEIEDEMRKIYIGTHLAEIYKSMYIDGVNVIGYTVWSAIDSLEWHAGYESRFGLYYVNVTDPARPRIPKASSYMMKGITSSRKIPQKYIDLAANLSLDIRPEKSQEPVLGSF
ncbi:cytosolic beta-glucosidase-like [Periplaneta americana]|uniref:cytosolic beta-glucosidase-like n=1 Tax=Periplaneta americana TaxID=6978 RepID=UPI0037E7AC93